MRIIKAGQAEQEKTQDEGLEMEAVNAFAKTQLQAQDVYLFSVLLCDNEVDRDYERFSESTLKELGELFTGATGICDHEWKSKNQLARIYRTELVSVPGKTTKSGAPYQYLKGRAYMLRTQENAQIIAAIEGGIKKETSVGCSVAKSICSICGEPMGSSACGHVKGREYGGKLCWAELEGAVDAYEWSFVAVPAQKSAGVIKKFDLSKGLEGFVESEEGRDFSGEFQELKLSAAMGRKYLEGLRNEVLRKCLVCGREWYDAAVAAAPAMDEKSLEALKAAADRRISEMLPVQCQLPGKDTVTAFDGSEYKI